MMRIGVVGCGRMGRERALAACAHGEAEILLQDMDGARARALAAELSCPARVMDAAAALDLSALDALFVCTPPAARGTLEVQAIRAGVPVFMEKPLGLSVGRCAPIQAALDAVPVLTAVGYMNRYRESVLEARRRLADREVLGFCGNWVCGRYGVPWWGDPALSGGPLNEQLTHMVDLARFLVGEVTHVQAGAGSGSETASVLLGMDGGATGTIFYSCRATQKMIDFHVFTTDEAVRLEGWDFRLRGAEGGAEDAADRSAIFRTETGAFLDAVRTGDASLVRSTFPDALRTQAVVDAIRQAAAHGGTREVAVDGLSPAAVYSGSGAGL